MITTAKPTLKQIENYDNFPAIANAINHVFSDAQASLSGHRKVVILLRKVQIRAIQIDYEEQFNFHFTKTVSKVLKLKKGEPSGNRVAKFCSLFVSTMVKQEAELPTSRPDHVLRSDNESDTSDADREKESVSCEFIDYLIRHLLRGIESRFKDVRFRIMQLLAYLVNYITEMDEQLFSALKYSLNRRLYDREAVVRIQAVVAISRFQLYEDTDPAQISQAMKSLLNALKHDESPEVRRAALLNLVKTRRSLPLLMERARDVNLINRRLVFSRISKELPNFVELDLAPKENLLNWGLNDREASVRSAAIGLLTRTWLPQVNDDILTFLENVQVVDSSAMPLAMHAIFESRRDRISSITIPPEFWNELTVEKAFFARSFFDYCTTNSLYENIDENLPELTKLAHVVQEYLKLREQMLRANTSLVDEYLEFRNMTENLDRLVSNGHGDVKDLRRKLEKEETIIAELRNRMEGLDVQISKIKKQIKSYIAATKDGKPNNEIIGQKVASLEEELKELTDENEEYTQALREHASSLTELEIRLKDTEKAQVHREAERAKFLQASSDLEERYRPFGDQKRDLEFVIEQILCVIKGSDFADVAGTRRLMPIITSALTNDSLNESNVAVCVRIIRKASINENYFSQLCTEIITDIRDSALGENDETFTSAASLFGQGNEDEDEDGEGEENGNAKDNSEENLPDKRRKLAPILPPDNLLIQCLIVLQHYLEIAEDTRCNSYQLDTLIDTLIRPALVNNKNSRVRFLGYKTLGLFSLIDEGLGASNLKFFGISASKANDEDLKALCMQIIFDIVSTHGVSVLNIEGEDAVDSLSLARLFYSLLKNPEMPHLQAVVAEGLCKLFLADLLVDFGKGELEEGDEDVLQEMQLLLVLLLSYFHPLNSSNQELKQVLAFCLPVYCFSHTKHQIKISSISGDCFYKMFRTDSEFEGYENLPSPSAVLQQLIYWCDPNHVINASQDDVNRSASHFWQALKFLQIIEQDSPKTVKKLIIAQLSKLTLSEYLGTEALKGLMIAINDTRLHIESHKGEASFSMDQASEKNLEKFSAFVSELIAKAEALEIKREESVVSSRASSRAPSRAASLAPSVAHSFGPGCDAAVSEGQVEVEASAEVEALPESEPLDEIRKETQDSNKVNGDLEAIDKILAEEAEVNYEIDMES